MRLAAAPVTPAFHAPTIVRIRPNAITAVAIPTMVSAVRRRCRKRFLKTSRRSFTAGPSLQFALVQMAYEMRALGGVRVVRHHHDGLLELPIEPLEQRQHLLGGLAVEVPRRLVGHEDRRIGGDGPRDRDPLLLAAGKLARIVAHPVGEADERERRLDVLFPLALGERRQEERQLDVLEGREHGDQVVELEHEPDVRGAPAGGRPRSTTKTTERPFRSVTAVPGTTRRGWVSTATRDGRGRKWTLALISGSTRAS